MMGGLKKKKCIEWKGEIAGTAVRWPLTGSVRYWMLTLHLSLPFL